jgi:hypothetical protein
VPAAPRASTTRRRAPASDRRPVTGGGGDRRHRLGVLTRAVGARGALALPPEGEHRADPAGRRVDVVHGRHRGGVLRVGAQDAHQSGLAGRGGVAGDDRARPGGVQRQREVDEGVGALLGVLLGGGAGGQHDREVGGGDPGRLHVQHVEGPQARQHGGQRGGVRDRGAGRGRPDEHLGQQRADQLPGVVGLREGHAGGQARPGDVALHLGGGRRVAVARLQLDGAGHRAAGLADEGGELLHGLGGDVLAGGDEQHAAVGEAAGDQRGGDGGLEGVAGVQLGLQLLGLGLQLPLVLGERGHLPLEVLEDRRVERRGADDDPQRDGQEDRDQRDQVVAEVDHEKRFSNQNTKLFHWSTSRSR